METCLKVSLHGQWNEIMHLICTWNSSSYSWISPYKIVYSLLILVVYAKKKKKMHDFQSQYASLTRWQTCTWRWTCQFQKQRLLSVVFQTLLLWVTSPGLHTLQSKGPVSIVLSDNASAHFSWKFLENRRVKLGI